MKKNLYYINNLLTEKFTFSLKDAGFSKITIKNYLTDINQFLVWRDQQSSINTEEVLSNYILEISNRFSKASIKRKISAIRKYLVFENSHLLSTSKAESKLSKIELTPFFVGILLILTVPIANYYMYSQMNNIQKEMETIKIPQSTTVSTSDGKSYNFENSKGLKVFLTNEDLDSSQTDIENPIVLSEAFENKEINNATVQGTTTIYKGTTQAIISSALINSSSFIFLTPKSSTNNQVLFIEKQEEGYAIISVDTPALDNIKVDWKIDNTEVYHSIL